MSRSQTTHTRWTRTSTPRGSNQLTRAWKQPAHTHGRNQLTRMEATNTTRKQPTLLHLFTTVRQHVNRTSTPLHLNFNNNNNFHNAITTLQRTLDSTSLTVPSDSHLSSTRYNLRMPLPCNLRKSTMPLGIRRCMSGVHSSACFAHTRLCLCCICCNLCRHAPLHEGGGASLRQPFVVHSWMDSCKEKSTS